MTSDNSESWCEHVYVLDSDCEPGQNTVQAEIMIELEPNRWTTENNDGNKR